MQLRLVLLLLKVYTTEAYLVATQKAEIANQALQEQALYTISEGQPHITIKGKLGQGRMKRRGKSAVDPVK